MSKQNRAVGKKHVVFIETTDLMTKDQLRQWLIEAINEQIDDGSPLSVDQVIVAEIQPAM